MSCVALGSGPIWAPSSHAYIPPADRTMQAIAATNRAAGRSQALQLELTMRVGGREPVARGELVSHPTGLARLELRGYHGRIERYLLSGRELMATRDGVWVEQPRPLLQPIFLLQPSSETTLRAALETFGVLVDLIGLAPCGDEDCFVFGDPRLAAPLAPPLMPEADSDLLEDALSDPLEEMSTPLGARGEPGPAAPLEGPSLGGLSTGAPVSNENLLPRVWVDTRDLEVRRIDRADGVFMIVGPSISFERLKVPAWFEIHEPGAEPIRFDVDRAVQVNAPPKAFSQKWLLTPVEPPPPSAGAPASPATGTPAPAPAGIAPPRRP